MRTISTLVLSAAMTALAGAASAEPMSISIAVTPADLNSPQAVASLYERVEAAAEEVCRVPNRDALTTYGSCKHEAIATALENAGIAELSAYAESLPSQPAPVVEIAAR